MLYFRNKISKMDALVENERLPRLRSEARIRTYKRNNERLATSAKRQKISTKTLGDLPDEVLLKIYAFLSIKKPCPLLWSFQKDQAYLP